MVDFDEVWNKCEWTLPWLLNFRTYWSLSITLVIWYLVHYSRGTGGVYLKTIVNLLLFFFHFVPVIKLLWVPAMLYYLKGEWHSIFMPRHQKVAGYYVIPSEILSVRPSVRLSVCPSVRPSAPTTILVSATPPTVFGESFWNFTGVLRMVWRYAYCFFRILKLFFITFFAFLT